MTTTNRVVEHMRALLKQGSQADREMIIDAAAEHAEEITALNDRLVDIGKLIDAGFLAEAAARAEEQPAVLEEYAELDLAEWNEWCQLLDSQKLEHPPALRVDLAERLDDLLTSQLSLEDLLKKFRLMNLVRAPVADRLQILRRLCQASSENAGWKVDLEQYERARLKEISESVESIEKARDAHAAESLERELDPARWDVAIPQQLQNTVRTLAATLRSEDRRASIQSLLPRLHEALLNFDVEEGQRLRDEMLQFGEEGDLSLQDSLFDPARDALRWLEEEERDQVQSKAFHDAVLRLETALENGTPLNDFLRLHSKVLAFGRELPRNVQLRASEYREHLELATQRRTRLILTAVIVPTLLVVGGIAAAIYFSTQARSLKQHVTQLQDYLEQEQYSVAVDYAEAIPQRLLNDSELNALVQEAKRASATEQTRLERLTSLIEEIRSQGFDDPNMKAVRAARELAEQAYSVEQIEDLRDALSKLEKGILNRQQQLKAARETEFDAQLKEYKAAFDRIEDEQEINRRSLQFAQTLRDLRRQVVELRNAHVGQRYGVEMVDDQYLRIAKRLIEEIEQSIDEIAQAFPSSASGEIMTSSKDTSFSDVTGAIAAGSYDLYYESLTELSMTVPDASIAEHLSQAHQRQPIIQGYFAWHDFMKRASLDDALSFSPAKIRHLIESGQRLLQEQPSFEMAHRFETALPELERLSQQDCLEPLHTILSDSFLSLDLLVYETSTGQKRFYVTDKIDRDETRRKFEFVSSNDGKLSETMRIPDSWIVYHDTAPQSELAKRCVKRLDDVRTPQWEIKLAEILEVWLHEEPDLGREIRVDPLCRLQVLRLLLEEAPASPLLAETVDSLQGRLASEAEDAQHDIFDADWFQYDRIPTRQAREHATELLAALRKSFPRTTFVTLRKTIRETYEDSLALLTPDSDLRWSGWVYGASLNEPTIKWVDPSERPDQPVAAYSILPVVPGVPDAVSSLVQIAQVSPDGNITWTRLELTSAGLPIYLAEHEAR